MSSSVLVALRISASPNRVFDAFTQEIALWWKPNTLFAFTAHSPGVLAFEPFVGGRFTETNSNGEVFEIGHITAWDRPGHLAFTWRPASFGDDQITWVDVRFESVGKETRVTVEHRGWESVPGEHVARHGFPDGIFLQRHGEWWRTLLTALRARI